MTNSNLATCPNCGSGYVPGDEFCGSCGTYLGWGDESRPAAAGGAAAGDTAAWDTGGQAPLQPGTPASADAVWPPVPADQAPTAPFAPAEPSGWGTPATVGEDAAAGLIRCQACGVANPPTRTFCQSCGTRLAESAPYVEPSAEQIAAAVAAPSWTADVPTAPLPSARPRAAAPGSRGFPRWLFVVGGLGLIVGVVLVAGSMLLSGSPPDSGATFVPGSGPVASGAPGAGASGGPGAGSPGTSGAPSVELVARSAKASSVIGNRAKFAADMAIDGDPNTCWQEGAKGEKGQWIEVRIAPSRLDAVVLYNGYQLSDDAYFANHRLKKVVITVNGGHAMTVTLEDSRAPQRFDLGGIEGARRVRIEIVSVYKSKKTAYKNSPFDDAALGEIVLEGAPG